MNEKIFTYFTRNSSTNRNRTRSLHNHKWDAYLRQVEKHVNTIETVLVTLLTLEIGYIIFTLFRVSGG